MFDSFIKTIDERISNVKFDHSLSLE